MLRWLIHQLFLFLFSLRSQHAWLCRFLLVGRLCWWLVGWSFCQTQPLSSLSGSPFPLEDIPPSSDALTFGEIGLGVLFGKLQQGVIENQQILQISKLRADAEDAYGQRLATIPAGAEKSGGFGRDDGASVRKVLFAFILILCSSLVMESGLGSDECGGVVLGIRWVEEGNG